MAVYIPTLQTEFVMQAAFDAPQLQALVATDVLDEQTMEQAWGAPKSAGDYVNMPIMPKIADFERADITSSSNASGTAVSTKDAKSVVCRDYSLNKFTTADLTRTGEDLETKLSRSAGDKIAKRILSQIGRVGHGAIPTAHVLDKSTSSITVKMINKLKTLLGDRAYALDTLLIHPNVWQDLVADLITTYAANAVIAGQVVITGQPAAILGVKNIIVSEQTYVGAGVTSSSAGDDVYDTLLLGPGALQIVYKLQEQESWSNILTPSTLHYIKFAMDYAAAIYGTAWNSTANPTDIDYADATKWDDAYHDHRDVLAARLMTLGNQMSV